jgi:hypothetical protein
MNVPKPLPNSALIAETPAKSTSVSKILEEVFYQLVLPLSFAGIVLFFFPSRAKYQFSFDEGVNLMKSLLMGKGYHLYAEIWSDQPPLFSYILTKVIGQTGNAVAPGLGDETTR